MTLPAVVRIFFAIEIPLSTKDTLGKFITVLKKKSKSHAIRWNKPDNLHITLQFLAQAQTQHLPQMLQNVNNKIAGRVKKISLTFEKLFLFPNPFRPRVIVLSVAPQMELAELARLIGEGIQELNYEIDARPFRPHLTLGRIKLPQGMNFSFLSECAVPDIEKIDLQEVVLFRSDPQPEGSRYTVMERITLIK